GALSPRKAADCAMQVGRGLAAAHEKGIIHRDLKPDNIFICNDGRVKVLDFGLAKLTAPESGDDTITHVELDRTGSGVVLGTAGYMSPEQVRGEKVDARSDIFSLGAVLYEVLTGKRAFDGPSAADRASAILKDDPSDLRSSGREIPMALDRIVRRCLEKNPRERFQSAEDLAFHLEILSWDDSHAIHPMGSATASWIGWAIVAVVMLAAATSIGWWYRGRIATRRQPIRFVRLTDLAGMEESPALSPDGKSVAFVSDMTGTRQIFIRLLAGGPPLQITHDAGKHLEPRWSPDSASIVYYTPPSQGSTKGAIWEVSALGGPPRLLTSAMSSAEISHDGKQLLFFRLADEKMQLVASDRSGNDRRVLTERSIGPRFTNPRWSPDDSQIAYIEGPENFSDDLYLMPARGGVPRRITFDNILIGGLAWLPDGSRIVYSSARGSTLLYLPTMHLWMVSANGGQPEQLTFGDSADESPDIDQAGHLVASRKHTHFDIWKFPVDGSAADNVRHAVRITQQTGQVQTPTLNPDDTMMAYLSDNGGHGNLWMMNLKTSEAHQITYEKSSDRVMGVPIWSPDGTLITFNTTMPGERIHSVYSVIHPDGSGARVAFQEGGWAAWSFDSKWLYYADAFLQNTASGFRLLKVPVEGGPPTVVRSDNARAPAVSPDESTLYYIVPLRNSNGLADYELRAACPESGPSSLLARIAGDRIPLWQAIQGVISKDGKWLALPLEDDLGTDLFI